MTARRTFSFALSGLLLAPLTVCAQGAKSRIAVPFIDAYLEAFKQGMREQGFRDGDVEYDTRSGQPQQFEQWVAEMVARKPAVLVMGSTPMVNAALKQTSTIPIVMVMVSDPVGNKFVQSLARPGGNVTGIATLHETVLPKTVEMLHLFAPSASRVAVLVNPVSPSTNVFWTSSESALRTLGQTAIRIDASSEPQLTEAFARMKTEGVQGVVVVPDRIFFAARNRLAALAQEYRLPAVYPVREHVLAGGLASYGPSLGAQARASARYVAAILKGAKPADLPVEQARNFELVVNRRTMQTLGIKLPTAMPVDEVIE